MDTKQVVKNFFSFSVGNLIAGLIGFAVTIYLARTFGPQGFGQIQFSLAFISYFLLTSDLGIGIFGAREIAKNKRTVNKYVDDLLSLKIFLVLISLLLYLILVSVIKFDEGTRKLLFLYGLSIIPLAFLAEWVFQGIQRMEFIGEERIIKSLFYALFIFLLVKTNKQILWVPVFYTISVCIGAFFLFYNYIKIEGKIHLRFDIGLCKAILPGSIPIGFSLIMTKMYYNMDSVFLGFMKGECSVGLYNAAYRIILFILSFLFIFGNVILPAIAKLYAQSSPLLEKFLHRLLRLALMVGLPLTIGVTILGNKIVMLVYGSSFRGSAIALQILIWAVFIIFLSVVYSNSLIAFNKEKRYMYGVATGVAVNTALNFLLIPKFDFKGAAIATVITELTVFFYMRHEFQKVYRLKIDNAVIKIIMASILTGYLLWLMRNLPLYISTISGIVAYSILLLITRVVTKKELLLVRNLIIKKNE